MDPSVLFTVGRCLIALLFLWSGLDKARSLAATSRVMQAHGIPLVPITLPVTIALEVVCSVLLLGNRFVPVAAALLALFVIVSSLVIPVRDISSARDPKERHLLQVVVAGNIALVGGLLYVLGTSLIPDTAR